MATISLEEAKARAKALRPYVIEARRQGVQLTGRGAKLALSGKVTPKELATGNETAINTATTQTTPQTQNPQTINNVNNNSELMSYEPTLRLGGYSREPNVQTLYYETPTLYDVKRKGKPDYKALGNYKVTEIVNLNTATTTRTTTQTNPMGDVIINREVTPKIRTTPNTENLPKPPTNYEIIGGNTGQFLKALDVKQEEIKNIKQQTNLNASDKLNLYVSESGIGATKYVIAKPLQLTRTAAIILTGGKRELITGTNYTQTSTKDLQAQAISDVLSTNTGLTKAASSIFEIGTIGTISAGLQSAAAPQTIKTVSVQPMGSTKVTKLGDSVVSFSKSKVITKYMTTSPKTGFIYSEGSGLFSPTPLRYGGSTVEILRSTTTATPFDKGILQTRTITTSQSFNPLTGKYEPPQVISNLRGFETEPIKTNSLIGNQYTGGFRESSKTFAAEGKTSYTFTNDKSGVFSTKATSFDYKTGFKTTTRTTGVFGTKDNLLKLQYETVTPSIGKKGMLGGGGQRSLFQQEQITLTPEFIVRTPTSSVSTFTKTDFIGRTGIAGIAGLFQGQQNDLSSTTKTNTINLSSKSSITQGKILTPAKTSTQQLKMDYTTLLKSKTSTLPNTTILIPPTTTRTPPPTFRTPPPPPPVKVPSFSLSNGGGSQSTNKKRISKKNQLFSIEPLVFSKLTGTARKGQRLGFKTPKI